MMRHRGVTACLLIAMGTSSGMALHGILAPGNAGASVQSVVAAHVCLPTVDDRLTLEAGYRPAVVENGFAELLYCPLVRYVVSGTLDDVWVRLVNSPEDDETISCCVHSVSLGGSFHDTECRNVSEADENLVLHFPLDDFSEFAGGHYLVTCSMGSFDGIRSIRTSES